MATHELVITSKGNEVEKFEISPDEVTRLVKHGISALVTLSKEIRDEIFDKTTRDVRLVEDGKDIMVFTGIDSLEAPLMPNVKPPKLENLNDMFKQLVSHYERFHPTERPVIGADSTDTTDRVESQLKQLIFDMYEHEHAVVPAPPAPPKGLHDCKGTYVGDLIHNYNRSQPKHSLQDYVTDGWTREQLLKEKMFIIAPAAPAPAVAPVTTVEQKELAIGQLLLDLKDNNLPESVRILVELLANLKK